MTLKELKALARREVSLGLPDAKGGVLFKALNHREGSGLKAAEPSSEELDIINSKFANRKMLAEEIWVSRGLVAHNDRDRDKQRFEEALLADFVSTAPGKAFKFRTSHDWRSPGEGRIFDSYSEKYGGLDWLGVKTYYLREGNEDARMLFDSGIWFAASIGFNASDLVSVYDDQGAIIYYEWKAPGELYEVSIVGVEAQQGAFMKSAGDIFTQGVDIQEKDGAIQIRLKEPLKAETGKDKGKTTGGTSMEIQIGGKSFEVELPETTKAHDLVKALTEVNDADAKLKALEEQHGVLKAALELKDDENAAEKVADLKARAKDGDTYRDSVITEALKYEKLAGLLPDEAAEGEKKRLEAMATERAQVELKHYQGLYAKLNPKSAEAANLKAPENEDPQGGGKDGDREALRKRGREIAERMKGKKSKAED